MITFKKIVEELKVDAPFEYYVVDDHRNREYLLWLDVLVDGDRNYFESLSEDKKLQYKTESARIFIPKMSIYKYKNLDDEGGGYSFNYTLNRIKSFYSVEKDDESLAVAVYMILHELGHWNDLKKKDFHVWEYAYKDSDESRKVFEEQRTFEVVGRQYDEETRKELALALLEKSNNTPIEGRANKYADEHFTECYLLVKKADLK